MFRSLLLATAILAAPAAQAGIVYTFAQEGTATGWSGPDQAGDGRLSILGQVTLETGAPTGFGLNYFSSGGAIFGVSQRDVPFLLSISVSLTLNGESFRTFDLGRMDDSSFIERFDFRLTGDASGLYGDFGLNDAETTARVQFSGSSFNVSFSSDRGDTGCFWGRCLGMGGVVSAGTLADPVSVPEPASMALFGMGLLGLWGVRRRAV